MRLEIRHAANGHDRIRLPPCTLLYDAHAPWRDIPTAKATTIERALKKSWEQPYLTKRVGWEEVGGELDIRMPIQFALGAYNAYLNARRVSYFRRRKYLPDARSFFAEARPTFRFWRWLHRFGNEERAIVWIGGRSACIEIELLRVVRVRLR